MQASFGECLKNSRLVSGLTKIQAGMKFFVTEKTIHNYETDKVTPSEEFVLQACEKYRDETLWVKYLQTKSAIGKAKMQEITRAMEVCQKLQLELSAIIPQLTDSLNTLAQLAA